MKCANCSSEALFEYQLTQEASILYCGKHLPRFLESRKRAGLLKITEKFAEAKKEVEEILAPEKPDVEEPVLEMNRGPHGTMMETSSEVTEASNSKKKSSKKKAE